MSWFSTMWDNNRNWLAPVATGAASLLGGPLAGGLVGAGMYGAQGHGLADSLGKAAAGGAGGAAAGYLSDATGAGSALKNAFMPSSATMAGAELPSAAPGVANLSGGSLAPTASTAGSAAGNAGGGAMGGSSLGSSILNGAKAAGSFAASNPTATGALLNGLGNMPVADAQARRLRLLNEADQYAIDQKKAQDKAMEPIRQAFAAWAAQQAQRPQMTVAPNPYTRNG